MLEASLQKNDKKAGWLIGIFSAVVFTAVAALGSFKLNIHTNFDVHIFAKVDAGVNSVVAVLLVAALVAVKKGNYQAHKNLMISAMLLSIVFLISYITHRLLAGDAKFGDINHDGVLSAEEKIKAGGLRVAYLVLLTTHIILAAVILPFILFTAYRGLTSDWPAHRRIAKYTWPIWFYVAITGPLVYLMIHPYYT